MKKFISFSFIFFLNLQTYATITIGIYDSRSKKSALIATSEGMPDINLIKGKGILVESSYGLMTRFKRRMWNLGEKLHLQGLSEEKINEIIKNDKLLNFYQNNQFPLVFLEDSGKSAKKLVNKLGKHQSTLKYSCNVH